MLKLVLFVSAGVAGVAASLGVAALGPLALLPLSVALIAFGLAA